MVCDRDSDEEQLAQAALSMTKWFPPSSPGGKSVKFPEAHFDKETPSNAQAIALGLTKPVPGTDTL